MLRRFLNFFRPDDLEAEMREELDSVLLIGAGVCVGLPLALGGTRWIKSFLFGIPALDPLAVAAAVLLILVLATFAAYLPAHRAARIDPVRALRHE